MVWLDSDSTGNKAKISEIITNSDENEIEKLKNLYESLEERTPRHSNKKPGCIFYNWE